MLQLPSNPPLVQASSLAFGIQKVSSSQLHAALIYRNDDGDPWLLHLRGHEELSHEPWDASFHWIEFVGIPVKVQELLADWAVIVAGNGNANPIPYSIILSKERNFAEDGTFINRNDGSGLTCATFLLKIFQDYGLPLIDQESWPQGRMSDIKWAQKILSYFRKKYPGSHFTIQLERVFKIKRFRPEETVSTAALYQGNELKFSQLQAAAKDCIKALG